MPSFPPEQPDLIERKLESLDQLSVTYTEAIHAMSQGDVDAATGIVEDAGKILGELQGFEEQPTTPPPPDPATDEARERLKAKAHAVLDLHTRLLDALHEEQGQVARQQKSLDRGRRHLDSLQSESHAGSILDSQA